MLDNIRLALVILSYNSANDLEACLESVSRAEGLPSEIVMVDNASRDSSVHLANDITQRLGLRIDVVSLPENLGCAGGNNRGWRATKSEIVVFLNPDTEVSRDFFSAIRIAFHSADIGIVGAKIKYPGGSILQHAGGVIHPNGMTGHFGHGKSDSPEFNLERNCDYVTGAGFAIRRSLLEELRGFREQFFPAYFEEVDLCTRARQAGYRIVYNPMINMVHKESVSLGVDSKSFRRLYQRMRIRYLLLNTPASGWRKVLGFERWWWRQPFSKGHRLEQVRAYTEGFLWKLGLLK